MDFRFVERSGVIVIEIPGEPELEQTLNDAVSSLAPARDPSWGQRYIDDHGVLNVEEDENHTPTTGRPGRSTYWIDGAINRIQQGTVEEIASGNMSMLLRDGDFIKPFSDYIDWPERLYPDNEITRLLQAWREAVLQ